MKLLVLDIETSPNLAHVWGLWDQNVSLDALVEVAHVMCFAAKWVGEEEIIFHSEHHDGHNEMILRAWELLDEADAVIHFNGKNFDIKHLNREFLLAGLAPPSPHKDIDLLSVVRQRFKFVSNKLQHISTQLGFEGKKSTGGFQTWLKCMAGDEEAWAQMKEYNIGDVIETEKVYEKLRPWVKSHPSHALYDIGDPEVLMCPNCGGTHLQKRGFYRTSVSSFQQYKCQSPACGAWSRQGKRVENVKIQSVS